MFVTTVCLLGGGRQLLLGGHKAGSKYYQVPGTCCCRVYRTMVTGIRRPFCFLLFCGVQLALLFSAGAGLLLVVCCVDL